jgi:hypothetical protein
MMNFIINVNGLGSDLQMLTFGIFDIFPDEAAAHLLSGVTAALTAKDSDLFVQPPPFRRSMSLRPSSLGRCLWMENICGLSYGLLHHTKALIMLPIDLIQYLSLDSNRLTCVILCREVYCSLVPERCRR